VKGVGAAFHPATVSSSQAMISSGVWGCWPAKARRTRIRWSDSAIFNQLPESGVYSGNTPWAKSQRTSSMLRCPARLSPTRISRNGGMGSGP